MPPASASAVGQPRADEELRCLVKIGVLNEYCDRLVRKRTMRRADQDEQEHSQACLGCICDKSRPGHPTDNRQLRLKKTTEKWQHTVPRGRSIRGLDVSTRAESPLQAVQNPEVLCLVWRTLTAEMACWWMAGGG